MTYAYDEGDRLRTVVDSTGVTWEAEYDDTGRESRISMVEPRGQRELRIENGPDGPMRYWLDGRELGDRADITEALRVLARFRDLARGPGLDALP